MRIVWRVHSFTSFVSVRVCGLASLCRCCFSVCWYVLASAPPPLCFSMLDSTVGWRSQSCGGVARALASLFDIFLCSVFNSFGSQVFASSSSTPLPKMSWSARFKKCGGKRYARNGSNKNTSFLRSTAGGLSLRSIPRQIHSIILPGSDLYASASALELIFCCVSKGVPHSFIGTCLSREHQDNVPAAISYQFE